VLHITTDGGQLIQPRDLFMLHEGAPVEVIVEHMCAPGNATASLVNGIRESVIGEGANLTIHLAAERSQRSGRHRSRCRDDRPKGRFSIDTTTLHGSLVRNEVNVALAGPEAHAELNGVYLLNGTTHCDNHTYIGHDVPDCTSDELYKGIVAEQRHRRVQRQGVREAGRPAHPRLPEQRQHPPRRRCPHLHQARAGDLRRRREVQPRVHHRSPGREGLFYLRSRGVSEAEARRMLSHAFMTQSAGAHHERGLAEAPCIGMIDLKLEPRRRTNACENGRSTRYSEGDRRGRDPCAVPDPEGTVHGKPLVYFDNAATARSRAA
jgi:Fe-S cluster assembly protein SufD